MAASGGRQPELRRDPLSGDWVIVAPARGARPRSAPAAVVAPALDTAAAACPFCPGNEASTPASVLTLSEADGEGPWFVRVVPNLFPAVVPQTDVAGSVRDGLFRAKPAAGVHEVVIETPLHDQELRARDSGQAYLTVLAYQLRLEALLTQRDIQHVAIFKNKGAEAGTSLAHPHSQIVGLNIVPPAVRLRVQTARAHRRSTGLCLICDLISREREAKARIVRDDDGFVAVEPYAAAAAGETLLLPEDHAPSFTAASKGQLERFAASLVSLLEALGRGFDDPPFNILLHTAPKRWLGDPALHWYLQLTPRLNRIAGFELGTGLRINPLAPEDAALIYQGLQQ